MASRPSEVPSYLEREIKQVAPLAYLDWNPKINRWQVCQVRTSGEPGVLLVHANEDGSYAHPDKRIVFRLWTRALWKRFRNFAAYERDLAEQEAAATDRERKVNLQLARDRTKEKARAAFLKWNSVHMDGFGMPTKH